MTELCQCGHDKEMHTDVLSGDDCLECNCRCFTPPVDEREKAGPREKAIDRQRLLADIQERLEAVTELRTPDEPPQIISYLDGQVSVLERLISDINFGLWSARDEEVERLRKALEHYASPQSWTDEDYATYNQLDITGNCIYLGANGADIARQALEKEKS